MANLLDYSAGVVTPVADGVQIPIPQTPAGVGIAEVFAHNPRPLNALAQINATVGVRGDAGTGSLLFRLFRSGQEIYYTRVGIESNFEQFYLIDLQAIDAMPPGTFGYTLSVDRKSTRLNSSHIQKSRMPSSA